MYTKLLTAIYFCLFLLLFTESYEWIHRWLKKPKYARKQNFSPFTNSGDINDAIFPVPDYVLQELSLQLQSFSPTQSSMTKLRFVFERVTIPRPLDRPCWRNMLSQYPFDQEFIFGSRSKKIQSCDGLSQVFTGSELTPIDVSRTKMRLPCLPIQMADENGKNMETDHDIHGSKSTNNERKGIVRYTVEHFHLAPREEREVFLRKFAQRMSENAIEFQNFCSMSVTTKPRFAQNIGR